MINMTRFIFVSLATLLGLASITCANGPPPPCFSDIYCHGPLLHTVQMAKIYEDSKTFVDMKMKQSPNETMEKFLIFMNETNNAPTKSQVRGFVNKTFEPAGQEFEDWIPSDWMPHPKFVDNIADENFRNWALHLNEIWKSLGRKMKDSVKEEEDLYSIIWVPNPVIVPGGRFREFYYWDSYWIVQGLLLSEMDETVKGMLENFLYIVDTHGHIPNGGRIYYNERSQPPLLIPMVKLYLEHTHDIKFIADNIRTMENEYNYWLDNRRIEIDVDGKKVKVAYYGDKSYGPRPESYSEDIESASLFTDQQKKEEFYSHLKAAAESGWDFSSRYFIANGTNKGNLTNIKTRYIIPVDLNALLYWNADILSEFHELLNNSDKATYYKNEAATWKETVTSVLWHEEVGSWLDYDVLNSMKRDYFYPSNIVPLFTGCYDKSNKDKIIPLVLKYLENKNIMIYPGGIPTSYEHTGEQWDYPNAWPPIQHMMIVGLNNTGDTSAQRLAYEIAEKWVKSNFQAYNDTTHMYEKYDASQFGGHGGGGEYDVQLGFGWSNGVIMDLLNRYGSDFYVAGKPEVVASPYQAGSSNLDGQAQSSAVGQMLTPIFALVISLIAGYIGISIYKKRNGSPLNDRDKRPLKSQYTELKNIQRRAKHPR